MTLFATVHYTQYINLCKKLRYVCNVCSNKFPLGNELHKIYPLIYIHNFNSALKKSTYIKKKVSKGYKHCEETDPLNLDFLTS